MRDRPSRTVFAALFVVAAVVASACSRPAPGGGDGGSDGAALDAAAEADFEGQTALAEGDAERAAAAFRRAAEATTGVPSLAPLRWTALYNVACSEARRGDAPAALTALAEALGGGLDGRVETDGDREFVSAAAALTLEHVVADPDLDVLRGTPGFAEVMRPYVAAGEVRMPPAAEGGAEPGRRPAVLVLRPEGDAAQIDAAVPGWESDTGSPPWIVADLAGPVRRGDGRARWLLLDGDERWAVAKVGEALEVLRADPRVDPARIHLAGAGPGAATAAWSAALAFPDRIAGVAVVGPRRLAAADEDSIADAVRARAGTPWRIVIGAGDEDLAATLERYGLKLRRASDAASLPAIALAEWRAR